MAGIFSRLQARIFGNNRPEDTTYRPEIDCIVDTASVTCRDTLPSGQVLPAYRDSLVHIQTFWKTAETSRDKEALLPLLSDHVREYPQETLRQMMVNFERKTRDIPTDYRDPLLTAVHEEIFDTHHRLMTEGSYEGERHWRKTSLREGFTEYCIMVQRATTRKAEEKDPSILSLHYALACYAMYIEDGPGHPVETPFPGGLPLSRMDGYITVPYGIMQTMYPSPSALFARQSRQRECTSSVTHRKEPGYKNRHILTIILPISRDNDGHFRQRRQDIHLTQRVKSLSRQKWEEYQRFLLL